MIKGPEGLVLAAESRLTLTAQQGTAQLHVNFDNVMKLMSFSEPNVAVGAVTYGQAAIGLRTASSFLPEFEAGLPGERLPIEAFAGHMSGFFLQQWQAGMPMPPTYTGPDMTFVVGGFDPAEPYGRVFTFDIPRNPTPQEQNAGQAQFGITWGGQREFVDRLLRGYDNRVLDIARASMNLDPGQVQGLETALTAVQMQIPLAAMPLQDCVDLALFFVRTTIAGQMLTVGLRGCGGPIDVATITRRENFRWVQKKEVRAEVGRTTVA
jgi:hypothetical protein